MKIRAGIPHLRNGIFALLGGIVISANAGQTGGLEVVSVCAQDLQISQYSPGGSSVVSKVSVSRLFTGYGRWGFFRIGLLPMLVAEDVRVEINSVDALTNALSGLRSWARPDVAARRLKLLDLQIVLSGRSPPHLQAATAQLGDDGTLQLTSVSLDDAAGHQFCLPAATLQLTGPAKGWLRWNANGAQGKLFFIKTQSESSP